MKNYYKYAYDVLEGKIVTGKNIKLACQRFVDDLKRDDLVFKEEVVDRAINFIGLLKHSADEHTGKPFILENWQAFIVANIIGFYWKKTEKRRFTSSYIEISRKNGKSALAAALCLYFLIADGVGGAQVIMAANSKSQVNLSGWPLCSGFAKSLDPQNKFIKCYRDSITFNTTNSFLKVIASDSSKLDGFNASFALLDEYHSAKNTKVRDVIRSSMAMRKNPHLCIITTAGLDKSLPCYELRTNGVEILNGLKKDDSMLIIIYSMDEEDNWQDEKNWIKCTPNLNVTAQLDFMKSEVQSAINNPSEEVGIRTKTLNQWCDSATVWIPEDYIIKCTDDVDISNFKGQNCYVGVDLAATSDLTAVSYMFVNDENGKYYFKTHYYLPESALNEKKDKETYKLWKRLGLLTVTPGNVTDYDFITADIQKARQIVNIISIAYDSYNATQWAIKCTEEGLPLEPFSQSLGNFNKPTKELERLLLSGKAVIDNNEITRQCFRNVALKSDHNNNVKPVKKMDNNKIDGIISMLQALGIYLTKPKYSNSIFTI